jgi:hypothetical protein
MKIVYHLLACVINKQFNSFEKNVKPLSLIAPMLGIYLKCHYIK